MKSALGTFAAITSAVLISLFSVWIYMRGKALSEPIPPPMQHPFLAQSGAPPKPYIVAFRGGGKELPENTLLAFDHAAALSPDIILWADLRPTGDGFIVAYREQDLSAMTDGKGWVGYTRFADIEKLNAGYGFKNSSGAFPYREAQLKIPTLQELLARYPKHRFILNFRDNRPGLDEKIIALIDEAKASDRVLIQSEENGLLKDLREKKPNWLFGTSQAQITILKMLASVGLEATANLKGDVYVSQVTRSGRHLISDAIVTEVKRRQMKLFVGPIDDSTEVQHLLSLGVDGIITADPTKVINQVAR